MDSVLKISKLKSGYEKNEVIRGINIDIKPGEIVAIIGPNGSGKSTLLKSIYRLAEIYEGQIIFMGREITNLPIHKLIREGIGYVPQGRQVFHEMSVSENLEMGAYVLTDNSLVKKRIQLILDRFPILKEKMKHYAFSLSEGQQQILSIARALMHDPKLLFLDEPSLGLAPKIVDDIFDIVRTLKTQGISMIIVEQNVKKVLEVADKVYVLKNGRVASKTNKKDLTEKQLEDIYFRDAVYCAN